MNVGGYLLQCTEKTNSFVRCTKSKKTVDVLRDVHFTRLFDFRCSTLSKKKDIGYLLDI